MENVPDAVYFKDLQLRFEEVNQPFWKLVGHGLTEDVIGKRLRDLVGGSTDAPAIEAREHRILLGRQAEVDVVRSLQVDGDPRWVSESRAAIQNADGEVIGLVGIARDVTERMVMEQALRASEARLQLIFQGSGAGLFDWNVDRDLLQYSRSFGVLLGFGDREVAVPAGDLTERVHPADAPRLAEAVRKHFDERVPLNNVELRLRVQDQGYRWFMISGHAEWNAQGKATRLAGSITDISIRKRQEERIAGLTRIHAMRGELSSAIIRVSDRGALLRALCRIAIEVGRFALAMVVEVGARGEPLSLLAREPSAQPSLQPDTALGPWAHSALVAHAIEAQRSVVVSGTDQNPDALSLRSAAGERWGTIAAFPLLAEGKVESLFLLFSETPTCFDREEEKLLEELTANLSFALSHITQSERLDLLAYYDAVTKLPNRRLLRDRLTQCIAAATDDAARFALLLLDVSRFRHINETLGWAAGDALLTQLAHRLSSTLPARDTLARLDGNTFAILAASVKDGAEAALLLENKLGPCAREPFDLQGTELRVAFRAGIALFPADGNSAEALLGNAETALRSTKEAGAPYTFYAPRMNDRVAEKLRLETKLRRAVENQEFLLHYQPKVDLKTGRTTGLEALVRWQEPGGNLIPPVQFIPVLEETGLIVEAGRWILQRAAEQYTQWVERGLSPPRIAVNVSARQLAQDDFVATVDDVLARFPRARAGIDLEITESVFVDNLTDNADKLRSVRQRGLKVAIDDFGTGYSSLGYLSRLPIDALKVDRSFVVRMFDDAQDLAIVTTIISLAHALELRVVAEGVETQQQAHQLRLMRCDELQGYLAAKPQPPEEVEALFGAVLLSQRGERASAPE
jgi:diguanylate cyclase (GGDEF)-like protein/PAS domain S-box-containing protein